MSTTPWQKSSYCGEGESCVHVATTTESILLTESSDLTHAILKATPAAFRTLLTALKREPHTTGPSHRIEITFDEGDDANTPVHLRETSAPDIVVTTDRRKWDAFVLGVQAGEFDHFAEGMATPTE
ncbi:MULTISPECIES: DUF397 domain-containing protein [Streptomyces]|uniref:DUF397 domain-containing protein n=1 Tax=Streptomyces TaxID=1883 RepID=UPI001488659D|nr:MULTISPECIES: DUF397 domain-containing protein [Streptomyces]